MNTFLYVLDETYIICFRSVNFYWFGLFIHFIVVLRFEIGYRNSYILLFSSFPFRFAFGVYKMYTILCTYIPRINSIRENTLLFIISYENLPTYKESITAKQTQKKYLKIFQLILREFCFVRAPFSRIIIYRVSNAKQ